MALIVVGVSVYLIAQLIGELEYESNTAKESEIDVFHKYSGIHPNLYDKYMKNKKLYDQTKDIYYFNNSRNYIEELALYADPEYIEEIHDIIKQRYLNNSLY